MPSPYHKKKSPASTSQSVKQEKRESFQYDLPPLPPKKSYRGAPKPSMFHRPPTEADEASSAKAPPSKEKAFPPPFPQYQPQNLFFYQDKEKVEDEETATGHFVCISPTTPSMQQQQSTSSADSEERQEEQKQVMVLKQESPQNDSRLATTTTTTAESPQEKVQQQPQHHSSPTATPTQSSDFTTTTTSHQHQHHRRTNKRARKNEEITQEKTRFKDIIGHGSVKLRIDELILPLGLPPAISNSVLTGIRAVPASILLHGPPGCGKTQLARAIAGEANAAFFSIAPSDVLSKFVGESEAAIRNIFRKAVVHALQLDSKCSVVFFDEIDALGQSRENRGSGEGEGCSRRVLAELLLQLNVIADRKNCTLRDFGDHEAPHDKDDDDDSYDSDGDYGSLQDSTQQQQQDENQAGGENSARIIVVAATNRLYDCDSALLRRFGIQLEVGLPSCRDRKRMLSRHLSEVDTNIKKSELEYLAAVTEQWSGSAIESLAREAAMAPVRECIRRAAVMRKRATKLEQSGGDASGQEDGPQSPDPDREARTCLLEGFQKLRPVSIDDFRDAIKLLTGNELPIGAGRDGRKAMKAHGDEHYDSSSSSDDE